MNREFDEAIMTYILIMSVLRFEDNPTKVVSKLRTQIWKGLTSRFLKAQKGSSVKVADPYYMELNQRTINAWDTTRRLHVPKDKELISSMGELVQMLWNSMNRNKYQELFVTEKNIMHAINSFDASRSREVTEQEKLDSLNNSRLLVRSFLDLAGIKQNNRLATRKKIIQQNMILEGKTINRSIQ